MTQDGERVAVEGDREDRISDLPRNVIDRILELLPVEDAARTSILSRKWRYIWAMLPSLVLGYRFCKSFKWEESPFNFKEAVDNILLMHMGDIVKFVLDTRALRLSLSAAIDRWMFYVTRNGVKELTLRVSSYHTYTLPSSIFNCSSLTKLTLFKCVFKPPNSFLGFQNLITLCLQGATFVPTTSFCVIKAPRLASLTLDSCNGTQYLNIVSPGLESLYVSNSQWQCYPLLNCLINCKSLTVLKLECHDVVNNPKPNEKTTLEKLLVSLPALEVLDLDSFFVELLSADVVPNGLPVTLNCLWHLLLNLDLGKMGLTSYVLQLIKNSPNLSKLEIRVDGTSDDAETVMKYLDMPSCLERPLNNLEHVAINFFKSSKAELLFVKLLLSSTPYLLSMCIRQWADIDVDIALELMRFRRASPRAELFYSQQKT